MTKQETDQRELKVRDRQNDIARRVAMLTNPKTKQIVVTDQEGADLASGLVTDSEMLRAEWRLEWYGTPVQPGDIPRADALHKSLVSRWRRIDTPLASIVTGCKNAINFWRIREQEKREERARKLEVKERKKDPEFVAPVEKVTVAGMTSMVRWEAEVFDLALLVQAVAKGKVDIVHVLPNQKSLDHLATDKHDMDPPPGVRWIKKTTERRT